MSSCCLVSQKRSTQLALAESEIRESASTLDAHLAEHPEQRRAQLLAGFVSALLGDEAPDRLRRHGLSVVEHAEEARREGVGAIASGLWNRLIALEALTPERAETIAVALAAMMTSPAQLFFFERQAADLKLEGAARHFGGALDQRHPDFRRDRRRLKIDRALLEDAGVELARLNVSFYADGHLHTLSPQIGTDGPCLDLDPAPGRGRYSETGKRGGYGFIVEERYEDGCAVGQLFSPWHDGDEYRTPKEWLIWVLECASEIASRRPRKRSRGKR
ncbi:MAG: hypothetical protein IT384_31580 [Deltaproteobacteria bacterium]|nr:hypothetical protein [Deltaproteobacteria bacterium]